MILSKLTETPYLRILNSLIIIFTVDDNYAVKNLPGCNPNIQLNKNYKEKDVYMFQIYKFYLLFIMYLFAFIKWLVPLKYRNCHYYYCCHYYQCWNDVFLKLYD